MKDQLIDSMRERIYKLDEEKKKLISKLEQANTNIEVICKAIVLSNTPLDDSYTNVLKEYLDRYQIQL